MIEHDFSPRPNTISVTQTAGPGVDCSRLEEDALQSSGCLVPADPGDSEMDPSWIPPFNSQARSEGLECCNWKYVNIYPELLNMAISSGFSHSKWWFSTAMLVITRGLCCLTKRHGVYHLLPTRSYEYPSIHPSIHLRSMCGLVQPWYKHV